MNPNILKILDDGLPVTIMSEEELLAVLEYARERVVFAPESSVAYEDTITALNLAIKYQKNQRITTGENSNEQRNRTST